MKKTKRPQHRLIRHQDEWEKLLLRKMLEMGFYDAYAAAVKRGETTKR